MPERSESFTSEITGEKMDDMYTKFMNRCKTERECVAEIRMFAEESGFRDIKSL